MPIVLDLTRPAHVVACLLDGVSDDQLGGRTPCESYPVAALLDHFMGLTVAFRLAAAKQVAADRPGAGRAAVATDSPPGAPPGTRPGQPSAAHLDPDWRTELPRRLDRLVEAWRDPAAWEGEATAGGVTLPADVMACVVVDELVLHGWDLARATGQAFSCDAESAKAVFTFTSLAARPEEAAGREGLFGPVVDVPVDAPLLDRALGLSGRDPAWRP